MILRVLACLLALLALVPAAPAHACPPEMRITSAHGPSSLYLNPTALSCDVQANTGQEVDGQIIPPGAAAVMVTLRAASSEASLPLSLHGLGFDDGSLVLRRTNPGVYLSDRLAIPDGLAAKGTLTATTTVPGESWNGTSLPARTVSVTYRTVV